MSEGVLNLYTANDVFNQEMDSFFNSKTEEIVEEETKIVQTDKFNYKFCKNNVCIDDKFIIDISNNKLTFDISANIIRPLPTINNLNIEQYFSSFNEEINLNYMYSPKLTNYIYYDLSNNMTRNIVSIVNVPNNTDFINSSPKSIFSDGTNTPFYLNSYMINLNKTDVNFPITSKRIYDNSGVQINIPDDYNTVWIRVLNSTQYDSSFNKIISFTVKTPDGKYLGTYSNNSLKYIGMQPNGRLYSNLPYTWIPIYVGNNKQIILNGDLLLTNSDLTKVINNIYDTNLYTGLDKNCNQGSYIVTSSLQNCIKKYQFNQPGKTDISTFINNASVGGYLNGFTGIAFSKNPYNHTKLSAYSLINPNSIKIKNTTQIDYTGSISPDKFLGARMNLADISNNEIITLYNINGQVMNINTNGFALYINPSTLSHSGTNKDKAMFNIPIIVTNNAKILYFWLSTTIPENLISLQLYYETNQSSDNLKFISKIYPIRSLTNNINYPKEFFRIKNMYGCILSNTDINNYFSQVNSIKTLDNNFGYIGISLDITKMTNRGPYPNEITNFGIYEIGLLDYYENIVF